MSRRERIGLLVRRLAAISYDALLLTAILFVATALAVAANGGEAIERGNWLYLVYLLTFGLLYFSWFWTAASGQTLGMRAWGLRIQSDDGRTPTRRQAAMRFFAAILSWICLGLGFARIVFAADGRAWHDNVSATAIHAVKKTKSDTKKRSSAATG